MNKVFRNTLKRIVNYWPWPLTVNERYDRQTEAIIKKICKPDSICIDIGCYRGDILESMIHHAPAARHIAFEPVPNQYDFLKNKYGDRAEIYPYALGNDHEETSFHHVLSNPTYSGLKQRQYKGEEKIQEIRVSVRRLDEVISTEIPIRLIKIDVEGGEFGVMKGAVQTISHWHPYIIFEHGLGGSDKYGVKPVDVYQFLVEDNGYKICLMGDFLKDENIKGFTKAEFEEQYWKERNCYFLGVPDKYNA